MPALYLEHPAIAALTAMAVEDTRRALSIVVKVRGGNACPKPVNTFVQAGFPKCLIDAIKTAGFAAPTPIQRQAWPVAMRGSDLVGLAETGSGKTLAYLLPTSTTLAGPHQ